MECDCATTHRSQLIRRGHPKPKCNTAGDSYGPKTSSRRRHRSLWKWSCKLRPAPLEMLRCTERCPYTSVDHQGSSTRAAVANKAVTGDPCLRAANLRRPEHRGRPRSKQVGGRCLFCPSDGLGQCIGRSRRWRQPRPHRIIWRCNRP